MKMHMVDLKGNKAAEISLKDEVFAVAPNTELLAQYIRVATFNKRQGTVQTKTRGDVEGSGAKPWSQKGTGRARVGEKRNPIWTKGGISHGPRPNNWNLDLNKKMRTAAIAMSLSDKIKNENLVVVEDLESLKGKTKEAVTMMKALKLGKKPLFLVDKLTKELRHSLNNINGATLANVSLVNAYQIIKADKVLATKEALHNLEKKLIKE